MEPEFWLERWQQGEIGFHQSAPNPVLVAHWHRLGLAPSAKVFVPLCGKSLDMAWLAGQGHRITGVELSGQAVDDFFESQRLVPEPEPAGHLTRKRADAYDLWCGDFFALPPDAVADIAAVYDRASLIALPPAMRKAYADALIRHATATASAAPIFLITLEYDQTRVDGPPHAVLRPEVDALFAAHYLIEEVHRATETVRSPRFRAAGLEACDEVSYILRPRALSSRKDG